jgi:hypothetical protein
MNHKGEFCFVVGVENGECPQIQNWRESLIYFVTLTQPNQTVKPNLSEENSYKCKSTDVEVKVKEEEYTADIRMMRQIRKKSMHKIWCKNRYGDIKPWRRGMHSRPSPEDKPKGSQTDSLETTTGNQRCIHLYNSGERKKIEEDMLE